MPKLLELRKGFKEAMVESLAAGGHGADGLSVGAREAEKLSDVTTHPPLRHKLQSVRLQRRNPFLVDWLMRGSH